MGGRWPALSESPTPVGCASSTGRSRKESFALAPSAPTGTCPQCQVPLHFPSLRDSGSQCVGAPQTHQQWSLVSQPQEGAGVAAFQNRVEGPFAPDSREPRIQHHCWSYCPIIPSCLGLLSSFESLALRPLLFTFARAFFVSLRAGWCKLELLCEGGTGSAH